MRRPLWVTLLALLVAAAPAHPAPGMRGRVIADGLDLFVEPDGASYSVGSLAVGEALQVVREVPGGWLAVEPPEGAFVWIAEADLDLDDDRHATVVAPLAAARAGRPGVRLPGPPTVVLSEGTDVTLMDVSPLSLRVQGRTRVFRAAAVPDGTTYYVRADGVRREGQGARTRTARLPVPSEPVSGPTFPVALATVGPAIDVSRLGAGEASTLQAVEGEHRGVLRQPIDRWQLERVRAGYRELRGRVADSQAAAALESRLALVARQAAAAEAARTLDARLTRSRQLDDDLGAAERSIVASLPEVKRPFDAVGLVQPSSKLVDGNRVFALVGPDGRTAAYLRFPPGVLRDPMTAQRVGIRGSSRYDETLQARVIDVRELETLGQIP